MTDKLCTVNCELMGCAIVYIASMKSSKKNDKILSLVRSTMTDTHLFNAHEIKLLAKSNFHSHYSLLPFFFSVLM
jgi:hypothetical protein